ncbi:MAG: IS66 family transposase [Gallionellaceae bacterium]|nr:IS66 family transposase [Gallionellaceae bacterium]
MNEGFVGWGLWSTYVKALSVYLHQQQMIPEDRLAMLFQDVFALPISATCLANYSTDFAEKIQPLLAVIAEQLRTAEVKHVDESGLRVAAKLHWTHVLSDSYWTYYRVSEKRGDVPQNLIGILIHDHFKSYYKLTGVTHGLCGAHHLRELKGLATIEKESWAKDMFALLQSACHQVNQGLIAPLSAAQIERDYDCIVKQGVIFHEQQTPLQQALKGRKKRRTGHNLVLRLRDYKDDALRFLYHANVPFTNNQAEQDVRMIKVKQKISGGFRTLEGAQAFAATRSYLSTMRKQCVNLFEAIMSPCHTNFTRYSG